MTLKEIMELTQWLEKSAFTSYSLSLNGIHISMGKHQHPGSYGYSHPGDVISTWAYQQAPPVAAASTMQMPVMGTTNVETAQAPASPVAETKIASEGHMITSPFVGTFYDRSNPESEPFVKLGQTVKKGDVLCILEAMKMMNELTADVDGTIAEIYIQNAEMVEARAPLFRIEV